MTGISSRKVGHMTDITDVDVSVSTSASTSHNTLPDGVPAGNTIVPSTDVKTMSSVTLGDDPGIDTQEMARFLGMVYGKTTDSYVQLCAFTHEGSNKPRLRHFVMNGDLVNDKGETAEATPSAIAEMASKADRDGILGPDKSKTHPETVSGWYIRMTTMGALPASEHAKGGARLTRQVIGFWADGDYGDKGHKRKPGSLLNPPDADGVRAVWKAAGYPEPSVTWMTGGGLNGLWMFPEPITLPEPGSDEFEEEYTRISKASARWGARLQRTARKMGWNHDTGNNLDRVLRLPGSVNRKADHMADPKPVYADYTGATYELDELMALCPAPIEHTDGSRTDALTGEQLSAPRPVRSYDGPTGGEAPWDAYNAYMWADGRFRQQLAEDGWKHHSQRNDVEHLTHPAKDTSEGNSATFGHNEDPAQPKLHVFSSSAPGLLGVDKEEGGCLGQYVDPYVYLAATQFAFDDNGTARQMKGEGEALSVCAKYLRSQGYGSPARGAENADYADLIPGSATAEKASLFGDDEITHDGMAVDSVHASDAEAGTARADRLPDAFWARTTVLRQIHQMARARRASPDAVLHAVLARVAAMADPTVRVDSGVHKAATLCWYCGLFGPSGAGKGNAENTAAELTPFPTIDFALIGISTGQGIIAAYLDTETDPEDDDGKKKITVQRRTRGYALATEGSVLDAMSKMNAGATLNGVLCSAWMSEWQATSNATVELRRALPQGAYTLSMSLGVQEEPAAKLLEMGNIGLPQRLAWAHATLSQDTPKERPDTTGPLTLTMRNGQDIPVTNWVAGLRDTVIPVPEHVTEEIDTIILEKAKEKPEGHEEADPLDTHEPLWRLKCAALLALLHGRTDVRTEEWDLALVMWQTSRRVRGRVQEAAERRIRAAAEATRTEAALTAAQSQAAVYEVINGVHPTVENVAKRARRYLVKNGGEVPASKLRESCVASKDRKKYRESGATDSLWTAALRHGYEQGWLVPLDGGLVSAGSSDPE